MRLLTSTLAATLVLLAGTACSGGDAGKPEGDTPKDVLAHAKELLDATSGVELELTSSGLPEGGTGVLLVGGNGTAMHPASFEGTLKLRAFGMVDDAEVIAVDGTVYAKVGLLGPDFNEVDPDRLGFPDPSVLLAESGGVSDLLVETSSVEEGESVRGGENNSEVLTEYTGTLLPGDVQRIIPSATGDFDVRYEIDSEGRLHSAELTGEFYPGEKPVTYTIDIVKYDVEKEITAP
jgi:lipoprotein LprG